MGSSGYSLKRLGLLLTLVAGAAVLSGCETTTGSQYTRAYEACDQRAAVCYSQCDDYSEEQGRSTCQSDCSFGADQCYATVRARAEAAAERARYASTYYQSYYPYCDQHGFYFGRTHKYHRPSRGYSRYDRYNRWAYESNRERYRRQRDTEREYHRVPRRESDPKGPEQRPQSVGPSSSAPSARATTRATPNATPQVSPPVTPRATPKATPKPTPKVMPKPAPKSSPRDVDAKPRWQDR